MKFALVALLLSHGNVHAYRLDDGLTYDDCQAAITAGVRAAILPNGLSVQLDGAPLVCEFQSAE